MLAIARKLFDFPTESDRLEVVICDAMDFLRENSAQGEFFLLHKMENFCSFLHTLFGNLKGQLNNYAQFCTDCPKFDVLLVDLSGGSVGKGGLYCPPAQFVTEDTLKQMRSCLVEKGT